MGASAMGNCAPHGSWGELPPIVLNVGNLTSSGDAIRYFKLHTAARIERVEVGLVSTTGTGNLLDVDAKVPGGSAYDQVVINAYDLDTSGASADGVITPPLGTTNENRVWPANTVFKVTVDSNTAVTGCNVVIFFKPLA